MHHDYVLKTCTTLKVSISINNKYELDEIFKNTTSLINV